LSVVGCGKLGSPGKSPPALTSSWPTQSTIGCIQPAKQSSIVKDISSRQECTTENLTRDNLSCSILVNQVFLHGIRTVFVSRSAEADLSTYLVGRQFVTDSGDCGPPASVLLLLRGLKPTIPTLQQASQDGM
jgi:hypothetical protein